jgi:hypothetical protein
MGANAVTTVYDFTAGQVLTAEQMDNVNSGVPVFATTVTRDAAFGGAGEKTLAQGQMAFVETAGLQFYNGTAWTTAGYTDTYTPVWTTSGTAPALGNGTLTGRFYRYDKFIFFSVAFTAGSTTTFGTGNFQFSTPTAVAASNNYGYPAVLLDNGTAWITRLTGNGPVAGLSDKFLILDSAGSAVTGTSPFTWTTGDQALIQGSYLIS